MHPPLAGIDPRQRFEGANEQAAVLFLAGHPGDPAASGIQCSAHIPLDVLAGREQGFLCPAVHPVRPDFGIQVGVHLVKIDRCVAWAQGVNQSLECPQTGLFACLDQVLAFLVVARQEGKLVARSAFRSFRTATTISRSASRSISN